MKALQIQNVVKLSQKLMPSSVLVNHETTTTNQTPSVTDIQEQQAIVAVQSGQTEQFVVLYDLYIDKIYRFLYFRVHHKELAEDLTSQTFLQAFDKIHQYDSSKGLFGAWLYRVARNLMIDEMRRKKPTDNIENHYDLQDKTNIEADTDRQLASEAVQKLLATLPPDARELLTLRLWDELSYAEIAALTGKSEGALKMQFSRLLKKLQETAPAILLALIFINL
ncbi:MAG TPA: sigma-70 family RNA polymerase sigma factor [Candidatus Doudnabacteria bacterium]|nr:sigma-70 family RNA polymerase sigma factor [Candidatus Doudnabacteria bacterium]